MPDFSMCASKTCEKRNQCYRATAKHSTYQSWSDFYDDCKKSKYRNQLEERNGEILVSDINNLLTRL